MCCFHYSVYSKNKPELDQNEESSMEQEDNLHKRSSTHTEHEDVSDVEVSGTLGDGNAMADEINAPTGPVYSQYLTVKGFSSCLRV